MKRNNRRHELQPKERRYKIQLKPPVYIFTQDSNLKLHYYLNVQLGFRENTHTI